MSTSDDALVSKAAQGDEEALRALLERYGMDIRNELQISSKWRGVVDAADVMQVTYLEAFLQILRVSKEPDRWCQWLRLSGCRLGSNFLFR